MPRPPCPVRMNCTDPSCCAFCVNGSEYRPRDRHIPFPARAEALVARREARRAARQSPAAKRGRAAHQKGVHLERTAARHFQGEQVKGSGRFEGLPNDVVLPETWRAEVKGRTQGLGLLRRWLRTHDLVAFREPDGPWRVAVTDLRFRVGPVGVDTTPLLTFDPALHPTLGRLTVKAVTRPGGFRQVHHWMVAEQADVLLFKADYEDWLVVMTWACFQKWAGGLVETSA